MNTGIDIPMITVVANFASRNKAKHDSCCTLDRRLQIDDLHFEAKGVSSMSVWNLHICEIDLQEGCSTAHHG